MVGTKRETQILPPQPQAWLGLPDVACLFLLGLWGGSRIFLKLLSDSVIIATKPQ